MFAKGDAIPAATLRPESKVFFRRWKLLEVGPPNPSTHSFLLKYGFRKTCGFFFLADPVPLTIYWVRWVVGRAFPRRRSPRERGGGSPALDRRWPRGRGGVSDAPVPRGP